MNWVVLSSLNEIYQMGKTDKKQSVLKDPTIKYLLHNTKELKETSKEIIGSADFKDFYERFHLNNFENYDSFLQEQSLKKPQTRFEENDIKILIDINFGIKNGDLIDVRNQIIEAEESVRGVSLMFFKNDKYLEGKPSLIQAVKQMLNIEKLANDKDQQFKYVLECDNPKCIVLCENLDFLRRPKNPRKNNIELWYAGGRNIGKLDFASPRGLPIFYSCDWDYDGLDIFSSVKEKISDIVLLTPSGEPRDIIKTEHKSLWKHRGTPILLSNLPQHLFSKMQKELLQKLIQENLWVIEESNNLVDMLKKELI